MTHLSQSNSDDVPVELSSANWEFVLDVLLKLGTGVSFYVRDRDAVMALRDRMVKQLP